MSMPNVGMKIKVEDMKRKEACSNFSISSRYFSVKRGFFFCVCHKMRNIGSGGLKTKERHFYLTTHSTHYVYGYMAIKDHSDSQRKNPLLLFSINNKGSFICTIPQTGYHISPPLLHQSWSTGRNEKWRNGSTMTDRSGDPSHHERTIYQ